MKKLIVCSVFALILVLSGCGKDGAPVSTGSTGEAPSPPHRKKRQKLPQSPQISPNAI